MRDASRAPCCRARGLPCFAEHPNRTRFLGTATPRCRKPDEYTGHDVAGELEPLGFRVTRLQKRPKIVGHWEDAAVSVLRRLWVQPHFAGVEIDLSPFERQDLRRNAPPRNERKLD